MIALRFLPLLCVLPVLPATALTDSNSNGLSDLWEFEYNNQQLLPSSFDPEEDDDGDGAPNHKEATAGTDPFDGTPPEGYFAAEVTHVPAVYLEAGGGTELLTPEAFVVSWPTYSGKRYTLLVSPDLSAGSWTPVEESIPGTGSAIQMAINPQQEGGGIPEKLFWRVSVNDVDTDGDGFNDWEESIKGTNSLIADSDDHGLPNDWEIQHSLDPDDNGTSDPTKGPDGDPDNDGLSNLLEYFWSGNPHDPDTDNDGLNDWQEAVLHGTSLSDPDTDGDGLTDHAEIQTHHTNPTDYDSDDDTLLDGIEVNTHLTNPLSKDTDGDTLRDQWEILNGLDPLVPNSLSDPDGDGLKNLSEQLLRLNPLSSDSDADGIPDGAEDPDKDTLTNLAEINTHSTNPIRKDTDEDGLPDNWEVEHGLDPTSSATPNGTTHDPDHDDLSNYLEWLNLGDPHDVDTDDDGVNDGIEVGQGTNLLDPGDWQIPEAAKFIEVPLRVGDPSNSKSEKWKLEIKGMGPDDTRTFGIASPNYGVTATGTVKLRKWNRYQITIQHDGTDPAYLAEDPDRKPDYDWEALVDEKPAGIATKEEGANGALNWFMLRNHWLVDNRDALLTERELGNEQDKSVGRKAYLIPVAIKDNIDATGVDSVSITAYPNSPGYQTKSWIMAPSGGAQYNNDMHFKIPLTPATDLKIGSELVTSAPETTSLEAGDPGPVVNWRGNAPDSMDIIPDWKIGTSAQSVDLPIGVKRMKKRTVNVVCYVVKRPVSTSNIIPASKEALENALNRTFGYQINAYFNVIIKPGISSVNYDLDNDFWLEPVTPQKSISQEGMTIVNHVRDSSGDIHVYYTDLYVDGPQSQPKNDPADSDGASYAATPSELPGGDLLARNNIFVSPRRDPVISDAQMGHLIAHEVGHAMLGAGHPDEGSGAAPLEGTDTHKRIMYSGSHFNPDALLLVKPEWDEAEKWLKRVPDIRAAGDGITGDY